MPERILAKAGDAARRKTGSPMRSRDGDDRLDFRADGVRLLVPGAIVVGLRAREELRVDAAGTVADQVKTLDAVERLDDLLELAQERPLPVAETVRWKRRHRDDRDRTLQPLFEERAEDRA